MIASWLHLFPDAATPLCINDDLSVIERRQFWHDVSAEFSAINRCNSQTVALHSTDSYDFLVLMIAALAAGKVLRLPPSRLAEQEREFAKDGIKFLARQYPVTPEQLPTIADNWPEQAQLEFYTSGSTGAPKCIRRTLAQLLQEVTTLANTFSLDTKSVVLATVSHQHIYGLLFKLLWPLAKGHSFYRSQLAYPEAVAGIQQQLPAPNILVASPALLKRWSADIALHNCQWVCSSGGMLAAGLRTNINTPLLEIYGSSETGGIAYRRQDNAPWQALNGVDIRTLGESLHIRAKHACQADWLETGDRARLHAANQFELLGRQDRIIKLEEKRISIDAVQQALCQHPGVDQAYVCVLNHGQRQFLGAALALSPAVIQSLQSGNETKSSWIRGLRETLSERIESVALPRHFRLISSLPVNTQGKLESNALNKLFDRMLFPVVLQQQHSAMGASFQLDFPPELECFKGHFPNEPIYPGLAQIGFVEYFAKTLWPDLQWVNSVEQMKFQSLIKPFMQLELQLTRQDSRVQFHLHNCDTTVASGRLLWQHGGNDV